MTQGAFLYLLSFFTVIYTLHQQSVMCRQPIFGVVKHQPSSVSVSIRWKWDTNSFFFFFFNLQAIVSGSCVGLRVWVTVRVCQYQLNFFTRSNLLFEHLYALITIIKRSRLLTRFSWKIKLMAAQEINQHWRWLASVVDVYVSNLELVRVRWHGGSRVYCPLAAQTIWKPFCVEFLCS